MSCKINYESVKRKVEEKSGGKSNLITTKEQFVDITTVLTLTCKCGNTFNTNYKKLNRIKYQCKQCRNLSASKRYRANFEEVKNYITSKGCDYISGEYINSYSLLTLKCGCGNVFQKDFNHFKRGQDHCANCGIKNLRQSKLKYTLESVKEILSKKGYMLLEDKYIDCSTPMKCLCQKGHKTNIVLSFFLVGCSGCKICANENLKGVNHWNYKGGENEVLDNLRKIIKLWKVEVAKKYNFKCALTNAKYDCVVHHLKPFIDIVNKSCKELGLPLFRKVKDYNIEDYKKLENLVLKKHTVDIGILLQRKVHNKFHSIYGVKNTTIEQFNQFVENYYSQKIKN